jgi:hypothetical protein
VGTSKSRGVFSGSINGKELNIVSSTQVHDDRVVIEHRSVDGKRGLRDEFQDRRTARIILYNELQKERIADAEAYRNSPCTPIFKSATPSPVKQSFRYCPDCDGSGWLNHDECPACNGKGWRVV